MEAEGLPRVRLAGAKGSGKPQAVSQPLCAITHCSGLRAGCFAQWFLGLWQCWTPAPSSQGVVGRLATRDAPRRKHGHKWADSAAGSERNMPRICSWTWQGRCPEPLRWIGGIGSVSRRE